MRRVHLRRCWRDSLWMGQNSRPPHHALLSLRRYVVTRQTRANLSSSSSISISVVAVGVVEVLLRRYSLPAYLQDAVVSIYLPDSLVLLPSILV